MGRKYFGIDVDEASREVRPRESVTFTLRGEVTDEGELYKAALAHAIARGMNDAEAIEELTYVGDSIENDGVRFPDVRRCVQMLLDSASWLPGFEPRESTCE